MKTSLALTFAYLISAVIATPTNNTPKPLATLFPHYLVHLDESQPDTPLGTKFVGTVKWTHPKAKDEITLIVGFDVPVNAATECYLKFTLPWATESNWVVTGSGLLDYYGLSRPVDHQHDCWNSRPQRVPPNALGQIQVFPGMDGVVTGKFPCHMGTRMDLELAACKPKGPTYVHWYELDMPKTGVTLEMWG